MPYWKAAEQVGAIIFGGGLNKRGAMREAEERGLIVIDCGTYARLHARKK